MGTTPETVENYLKQIYELSLDQQRVRTSQIADGLKVSPAAVTEMLKRMESQKLVKYRPYKGVELSTAGRKRALGIVRRHRLWEVFLHRVLGMPWTEIHDHACRLEHGTDDRLAALLDEHLGHPRFDPHGDPIPGPDGSMEEIGRLRLSAIEVGDTVTVAQCTDENPEMLTYLKSLGLVPGTVVTVTGRAPFNGPLTLEIAGTEQVVGVEVADTLIVQLVEDASAR